MRARTEARSTSRRRSWPAATFAALGSLLISTPALAEAPLLSSSGAVDDQRHASLIIGTSRVGAGAFLASEDGRHGDAIEAVYAPSNDYLEARAARAFRLTEPALFNLSAQAGLDALITTRGPVNAGGGPQLGLNVGVGHTVQLSLSAQAGAEAFAGGRDESPFRFPLRMGLGFSVRAAKFRVELWGRAGADFQPGLSATARYDGTVVLGWVL